MDLHLVIMSNGVIFDILERNNTETYSKRQNLEQNKTDVKNLKNILRIPSLAISVFLTWIFWHYDTFFEIFCAIEAHLNHLYSAQLITLPIYLVLNSSWLKKI